MFLAFLSFTLPAKQGVNNRKESIMKKWNVVMIAVGVNDRVDDFCGSFICGAYR